MFQPENHFEMLCFTLNGIDIKRRGQNCFTCIKHRPFLCYYSPHIINSYIHEDQSFVNELYEYKSILFMFTCHYKKKNVKFTNDNYTF